MKLEQKKEKKLSIIILIVLFPILISILVISSCKVISPSTSASIALKDSMYQMPLMPLYRQYANYLVSTESYVRIYAEKKIDSTVLGIARRGDYFVLISPQGEDENGYAWYEISRDGEKAWIKTLAPQLVYSLEEAQLFR